MPPNHIKFDFLGKDSIRYENTVDVEAKVYKAVEQFTRTDARGKRECVGGGGTVGGTGNRGIKCTDTHAKMWWWKGPSGGVSGAEGVNWLYVLCTRLQAVSLSLHVHVLLRG